MNANLGRLWAGKLFGTNIGNLAADLETTDKGLQGVVRFMDDRFGVVVYAVSGSFDGSTVKLTGAATLAPDGVQVGTITVEGALTPEGHLRGTWTSTIGTGGTFQLFPHDAPSQAGRQDGTVSASSSLPEQMHTATRFVGAVRLYADDVVELMAFIRKDFNIGRVVVTYNDRGTEISKYGSDFQADMAGLGELRYLKLVVQEPDAHGVNRLVLVELNAIGTNEVRVQGVQETWVIGKVEAVATMLRKREKVFASTFRKWGLNVNGLMALAVLIYLPELTVPRRIVFVLAVFLIAAGMMRVHSRYIPNALIHLSAVPPSPIARILPQIMSWLIAATSAFVATLAYGLLKGELPEIASWFK